MLGVAASSPVLVSLLQGCSPKKELGWTPAFLTEDQAQLTAELSETILPKTDLPGAIDIGVDAFIDMMVNEVYTAKEQTTFTNGLTYVDQLSKEVGGDTFINIDATDRSKVLEKLETTIADYDNDTGDKDDMEAPFFYQFKELTLLGYFTSEEIMTKHLNYVPIPARFEGCAELEANQKVIVGNHV